MNCTKCSDYSYSLKRCTRGMINPKTIKGGVEAARFMGLGYICDLCDIKPKIMEKLYEKLKKKTA